MAKNKVKKVEETVEKEVDKDFVNVDSKEKSGIAKKIFNVIFWVVIVALLAIWLTDFFLIQNNKKPKFCVKNETLTYDDGTVDVCWGLGYKIYDYHRPSINISKQFSPFFIGPKE